MGGHDAELILVGGALLAAGIAGALLAERMRIPGLLLFLALGMLAGSEGLGGIHFDDADWRGRWARSPSSSFSSRAA